MPRVKEDPYGFGPEWSSGKDLCEEIVHHLRIHRKFAANAAKRRWYYQTMGKAARSCRRGDYYGTVSYLMAAAREEDRAYREHAKRLRHG